MIDGVGVKFLGIETASDNIALFYVNSVFCVYSVDLTICCYCIKRPGYLFSLKV